MKVSLKKAASSHGFSVKLINYANHLLDINCLRLHFLDIFQ